MKRTIKYALSAAIGAALVVPAYAQDNFPDVPANHWAYEALARMKANGLLVGYPDGLFRGGRPASRYELAVAIHATYTALKNQLDGLDTLVRDIERRLPGGSQPGFDPSNLQRQLDELRRDVDAMKGMRDDLANLRRMADTFQKELQSIGVDVEAMKRDLGDLADRVTRLERRRPAVDVSGDLNLWLGAGNSRDGHYGLNKDGRIQGTSFPAAPFTGTGPDGVGLVGGDRDLSILHEAAFTFAGTNDTGPRWRGTVVVGNMFAGMEPGFINQAGLAAGVGYGEPEEDVYIQDLGVRFDTSVAGLGFNVEAGRIGYKVSPMMYQRPDYTSYFSNTRWDDGLWRMDGAVLGFNFGGAKLDVMAGKVSTPTSVNGNPINPMVTQNTYVSTFDPMAVSPGAGFMVDRVMGVNLNVPLTTNGNLNLAYLWLNNDDPTIVSGGSNRVEVYGGNAEFNVGRVKLEGGWSASNVKSNDTTINDDENNAWYARLGWTGDRYGFFAGYRRVEDRYIAPGDWGRVGIIRNPANLQGFQVGANIDLTGSLSLNGSAEILEGISNTAFNPYFNADTEVQRYVVNLGYQLNPNLMLNVGHEYNRIEGQNQFGGWPARYAWWSFGVGYGLSQAAKLTIQYEISDVSGEFTGVNPNGPTGTSTIFRGGFLTTQLSVKF